MASPIYEQGLTLEDVLEIFADELGTELTGREIDSKGISKVEMQKAFIKILFPVVPEAPVVTQPVSPRTALSPQQQMELEVMKIKMESEEREKRLRIEAEERKELPEREKEERAEALEKRERREQDRQALEKKEAIEREERA